MSRANVYAPIPEMNEMLRTLAGRASAIQDTVLTEVSEHLVSEAQGDSPFRDGHLQASHRADYDRSAKVATLGAYIAYALAVHALHPTKAGWFLRTITTKGPAAMKASLELHVERRSR